MKKSAIAVATAVAFALLGAPTLALADDHETPNAGPANVQVHQDDSDVEHEDDGDNDHDDNREHRKKGWIPPVAVVPGAKHNHTKPVGETPAPTEPTDDVTTEGASVAGISGNEFMVVGVEDTAAAKSLDSVDPKQAQPIAIQDVKVTTQNPAERFMDSAYLGIGALALSAVGLAGTAAVRSIRSRKSGKSDYFYDN